jgi:hypothetical protein
MGCLLLVENSGVSTGKCGTGWEAIKDKQPFDLLSLP